MKDKKRMEMLLKVIEKVYSKKPGMQTLIDESMIDICKEEGVFLLFFAVGFIFMGYLNINFLSAKENSI